MEIKIQQGDLTKIQADTIVVNLFQGVKSPGGATGAVDQAIGKLIAKHIKNKEFIGKECESLILHSPSGVDAKHVVVVGLGKQEDFSPITIRKIAAKSIQIAKSLKAKKVATVVHGAGTGGIEAELGSQMIVEGLMLGGYEFLKYKTKNNHKEKLTDVVIVEADAKKIPSLKRGHDRGLAISKAIIATRDLVNESPSKVKPITLVEEAKSIGNLSLNIKVTVLNEAELKKEKYNALLAVAAGSDELPYLIHLHYKPPKAKESIAFIGKGVTFDSGGLGIKPWQGMLTMKTDMAGGAAVLGILRAIANLEKAGITTDKEVHGVVVATENMISGKAMKPDDIIETKNGKTIEVLHTDAEGRLILADGLVYTEAQKPDEMIDYATLTGAAIKALGRSYAAYMGNDEKLLARIKRASANSGELAWELPLPKEYAKFLDSPIADIQNIAMSDYAPGAIIGGLFLQEFVDKTPWAHVDIAGPSYNDTKDGNPVYPFGATGFGVLLGLDLINN